MTRPGRVLVTGAGGQLGSVLMTELLRRGVDAVGLTSQRGPRPPGTVHALDLLAAGAIESLLPTLRPTVVVHLAALSSPAAAERQPALAQALNVGVTQRIAEVCDGIGARMLLASTDMVFDGEHPPYTENSPARPNTEYGRSKLRAEAPVRELTRGLVLRIPLLYGFPHVDRPTTFRKLEAALRAGELLHPFHDEVRTPASLGDCARAVANAAQADVTGLMHLAGPERLSRLDMLARFATALGLPARLEPTSRADYPGPEARPQDLSMRGQRYLDYFGQSAARPMGEALRTAVTDPAAYRG